MGVIRLGSTSINKMYLGVTVINKVYLGNVLVYSGVPDKPTGIYITSPQSGSLLIKKI